MQGNQTDPATETTSGDKPLQLCEAVDPLTRLWICSDDGV